MFQRFLHGIFDSSPSSADRGEHRLKKAKQRLDASSARVVEPVANCRLHRLPVDWLESGNENPLYFDSESFGLRELRRAP